MGIATHWQRLYIWEASRMYLAGIVYTHTQMASSTSIYVYSIDLMSHMNDKNLCDLLAQKQRCIDSSIVSLMIFCLRLWCHIPFTVFILISIFRHNTCVVIAYVVLLSSALVDMSLSHCSFTMILLILTKWLDIAKWDQLTMTATSGDPTGICFGCCRKSLNAC